MLAEGLANGHNRVIGGECGGLAGCGWARQLGEGGGSLPTVKRLGTQNGLNGERVISKLSLTYA